MLRTIEFGFAAAVGAALGHVLVLAVMTQRPAAFEVLDERLDHRPHSSDGRASRGCPAGATCSASRHYRAIHRVDVRP